MGFDRVIAFRPDTKSNWQTNNTVLAQGEGSIETDTGYIKIGDGSTAYNDLDYATATYRKLYNITTSTDVTVNLPDANTVAIDRLYYRTGSGAGKVLFSAYGTQTINGIADTNWSLDGEESILLSPVADGWRVLMYAGYDESGNLTLKPASGGRIIFDDETHDSLGTPHWVGDDVGTSTILNITPTDSTWYTVTFSNAPDGAKAAMAQVMANSETNNNKRLFIRKKGETHIATDYNCVLNIQNAYYAGIMAIFPLDSNKQAEVACINGSTLRVWDGAYYFK